MSSSGMADVGAYHTVDTWRHVRGFTMFAWYDKCQRPQHYRCPEACGGDLTVWELMAPTILEGKMSVPTTLFGLCRAREVVEYGFCRCTRYGL